MTPDSAPTYDVVSGRPSGNLRCLGCLALFPIGRIHRCGAETDAPHVFTDSVAEAVSSDDQPI